MSWSRTASAGFAVAAVLLLLLSPAARLLLAAAGDDGGWEDAHATFYGDETGAETMQGACGYGNLFEQGYGLSTTALSVALFNEGWSCGACFQVQCRDSPYCAPGISGGGGGGAASASTSITVTATNLCPANYSKPNENWCNPPLRHFDLSKPMFLRLVTDFRVGIVPVRYRRVPCVRSGGVRFQMTGHRWWVAVVVFNVAGAGDVRAVAVTGSSADHDGLWTGMNRNWGQVWNADPSHVGQGLSFRVVAGDGRAVVLDDVVPPGWAFGQSFEGSSNF